MKQHIERLKVSISLERESLTVGELLLDQRQIYFKYHPDFLASGLLLSPLKLPLSSAIHKTETVAFDGLFGVFSDSLPDGWGRLLLDRSLVARGIDISTITPLDRLAYIGKNGMGALVYEPELSEPAKINEEIQLDRIAQEVNKVISGSSTEIIAELYQLGGSSGGARPKIFVGYNPEADQLIHGTTSLLKDYEHWIVKFPAAIDPVDVAQIEYAYYLMAIDVGLEMAPSQLFEGKTGKYYFGTKRFDRQANGRLHLHSVAGLMHDNFRLSNMDYGHLMDAAFRLEQSIYAYEKILRLAAFNVYAHNRDDHSKNVSFLMDSNGVWRLAPVYDLTFSNSSHGFHSMMVAGEGREPGQKQLLELAQIFGISEPKTILEKVKDVLSNWATYAKDAGVSKASQKMIAQTINRQLGR